MATKPNHQPAMAIFEFYILLEPPDIFPMVSLLYPWGHRPPGGIGSCVGLRRERCGPGVTAKAPRDRHGIWGWLGYGWVIVDR